MSENKDHSSQDVAFASQKSSLRNLGDTVLGVLQESHDSGKFYREKDQLAIIQALQEILSNAGGVAEKGASIDFSLEPGPYDDLAGAEGVSTQMLMIEGQAVATIINDNGEVSIEAGPGMEAWLKERVPRFVEAEKQQQAEQERMHAAVQKTKQKAAVSNMQPERESEIRAQAMDAAGQSVDSAVSDFSPTQTPPPPKKKWWQIWKS